MRRIFVMSVLALAIAGCANQQDSRPEVRDLSDTPGVAESVPSYTVKAGDTLYGIAWEHNRDYRDLAEINGIDAPYNIYPGQEIRLQPGGIEPNGSDEANRTQTAAVSGGAVAAGLNQGQKSAGQGGSDSQQVDWLLPDEPADTANDDDAGGDTSEDQKSSADGTASADAGSDDKGSETGSETDNPASNKTGVAGADSRDKADNTAAAGDTGKQRHDRSYEPAEDIEWQWPADGKLAAQFDEKGSITAGIDIAGEKGQSVKAAGPGIVVYAGSGVRGYGKLVLLKHNDRFLSAYAHNDSLNVSENDVIRSGEVIATMGDSDADSVKLHFEVRKDGEPQDPMTYLPSR